MKSMKLSLLKILIPVAVIVGLAGCGGQDASTPDAGAANTATGNTAVGNTAGNTTG
jgi:hypothetical protein